MNRTRSIAWIFIAFMLATAASPATAFAIPAGATMMPMRGGPDRAGPMAPDCNCAQSAATATRAEPLPRPATAGSQGPSPCNGTAQQVYPGATGLVGRVSGIRKLYAKNVLDHPERSAVYTLIVAKPGIDLAQIALELGMNRQTLRYHLDLMESFAKIVVARDHGIVRYYENHGRFGVIERNVLLHQWNPTASGILSLIQSQPGITQSGIAMQFAITAPTVRWYMQRFRDDGIITEHHEGRYTRYNLTDDASRIMNRAGQGPSPVTALS